MNSAYYCDHVCCWNKDYCQKFTICRKVHWHTVHATLLHNLHSRVSEFIKLENCGLFSVKSITKDGVSSQSLRHWPAETRSNQLLDSAKLGYIEPSDQSAAKKTVDGYQGKSCPRWICLDTFSVQMFLAVTFIVCLS